MLLPLLFSLGEFVPSSVRLMLLFLNSCLIIAVVSVTLFPRFAQSWMHTHCQIHCDIASGQIRYSM
jgi:hypothetical protein